MVLFHDRTGTGEEKEATLSLDAFPSPKELWARYCAWKGLTPDEEAIVLQDDFEEGSGKGPRYHQTNAINAAIEAIAKGQDRIPSSWPPEPARLTWPSRLSGGFYRC
jgi:type I restriction enzyme R subunit